MIKKEVLQKLQSQVGKSTTTLDHYRKRKLLAQCEREAITAACWGQGGVSLLRLDTEEGEAHLTIQDIQTLFPDCLVSEFGESYEEGPGGIFVDWSDT